MVVLPVRRKECQDGRSAGAPCFGVASMQGWREEMEDAHLALPDFDPERGLSLFGVFDGHGGEVVAQLVSERLPETLRGLPEYRAGRFQEALFKAFMAQDDYLRSPEGRRMLAKRKANAMGMGSTAVVALLNASKRELFVANCGDSRAVLVSGKGAVAMWGASEVSRTSPFNFT
ncbi:unnamed protein product [Effrenium voratum]|uniref:PPM-type phosphatase domain-containing protein n=1 Tax=Effrenium voratum TaxID=2562239 RepID=A0AA36J298_9DINO|nr:unnamed protein product [Effrenium voratum]